MPWRAETVGAVSPEGRVMSGPEEACRVLVPLDGSPLSESALVAVERLARSTGTVLVLLRVVGPARPVVAEGRVIMAADELTALHRHEAAEYLERIAIALRGRGLRIEAHTAVGEPAETILGEAVERGVAAIVMATHGRTGIPRILFGSVTAAVVRTSRIPVLTVHHQGPADPASLDGLASLPGTGGPRSG